MHSLGHQLYLWVFLGGRTRSFMEVEKARDLLHDYATYVADEATEEFKPSNVVNIPLVSDRRAKNRIADTLEDLRDGQERLLKQQYSAVLDGAAGEVEDHLDDFLDGEIYLRKYRGDDEEFSEAVEERYRSLCKGFSPVTDADSDGLWQGFAECYERDETEEILEDLFGAYWTAKEFQDDIVLSVKIPLTSKEYEYTEESLRAFGVAEKRARERASEELDDVY